MRPEPPTPLPYPVVDSHCHLDISRAGTDGFGVTEALDLAAAVNVRRIVQIGCDLPGARWAVAAAERYDQLVAGVALHPNEVPALAADGELEAALHEIETLAASSPRVRAIGETGLDHFRTPEDGWAIQETAFVAHIDLARRLDKTLVIHDRDAHADVLRVLSEHTAPERVVMHCFSGDAGMARECVARGYWLSFAGTVTFGNADAVREALAVTPLERILVETDAPYLTPVPYRGKNNASYLVPYTVRRIAEIKDVDEEFLCRTLTANTEAAFGDW
ncbi:MAG TPA: TatD family hydrolase [Actinopolymorphaceae bacterium]